MISVEFDEARDAEIAKNTLDVDKEPNSERVHREITVDGTRFMVKWHAKDVKILRTAVLAFFLNLELVVATILNFKPKP